MDLLTRCVVLAVTIVAVAACDLTREAPLAVEEERVAVYSVLEAGSDSVAVFIIRTPVGTEPGEPPFSPVSGADVRITTPGDAVLRLGEGSEMTDCFSPLRDSAQAFTGSGCYLAPLPGGVRPGGRYALRVRLPDGAEVEGEAVVPGRPEIAAPDSGARISFGATQGEFPVRFDAPTEAGRLHLVVSSLLAECSLALAEVPGARVLHHRLRLRSGDAILSIPDVELRTVTVRFRGISCESEEPPDVLPLRLHMIAYDSAYARYLDRVLNAGGPVRPDRISAGITGAFGLFAGAASDVRPVSLIP